MGALEALVEKYDRLIEKGVVLPAVSLEDFFVGNEDRYSIGANFRDDQHPGVQGFFRADGCPGQNVPGTSATA